MNAEDAKVVEAVGAEAESISRAIEWAADRFRRGGRLIYAGAGTSGRLGVLDAAECPPTFSTPHEMVVGLIAGGPTALTRAVEGAEDDPDRGAADIAEIGVGSLDLVVGIATSGTRLTSWAPSERPGAEGRPPSDSLATALACSAARSTSRSRLSSAPRSSRDRPD